ncbi:hypothetical protein PPYR_11599 [Photinus pyralis]|uniref:Carboxypeptidase inhibitor n=1 Tax=Photinus pyralis TaxID=7054 RepID=A0A5N4ABQ0_PHOPY|nr:U-scoloptoxin(19)-Sm1a [Photinus pyralis]KAB0794760.1 hypothetical protein PPYR_11599 [Photinus pyralis]
MMSTYAVLIACLLPMLILASEDFKPEGPCNKVGGQCVGEKQCASSKSDENLCPMQKDKGAVCCRGQLRNEFRCHHFGGICLKSGARCNANLRKPQATDCQSGEICCVLLQM